jgi:predicted metal-dependent phosphoesterase TrpH
MLKKVSFEKPDYKGLIVNGFSLFDMHVHTKHSDGANKVETILKRAKKLGIGVAITDHNEIIGALNAWNNSLGVPVIPGIELTTLEGLHLLFYFPSSSGLEDFYVRHIQNNKFDHPNFTTGVKTSEILRLAKNYDCLVSSAHPFSPSRLGLWNNLKSGLTDESILGDIPAFEVLCGSNLRGMNKKAIRWAWELDKCVTGGSDAHIFSEVGKIVTYSKAKDIPSFLADVKNGNVSIVGLEPKNPSRLASYTPSLYHNYIRNFKPAIKVKYKYVVKDKLKATFSKLMGFNFSKKRKF